MNAAAILNHLWQSTAFAGAAAMVAWALRNNAARVRFAVWLAASLKFLVPFSALAAVGASVGTHVPATASAIPAVNVAAVRYEAVAVPLTPGSLPPAGGVPWMWILGSIWIAGSAALGVRWWLQWRRTSHIARRAMPQAAAGLFMRVTEAAVEPGVFGVFRPVLLVPKGIEDRLTAGQFEAVLTHERCHVRRRDNLWAALHRVVETAFWFHPFVWWIGARMIAERERACDEAVLSAGGDAVAYAGGLVNVCRHYLVSPLACAAGVSGGPLQRRVREILDGRCGRSLGRRGRWLLAVLGAAVLLGPVAAGMMYAQSGPAAFSVASIRPSDPAGKMSWRLDPQRLTAENMSLKSLIITAYGLFPYQVVVPDWMAKAGFSISATTAVPLPEKAMTALLQPFLVRQFNIKLHREAVRKDVYFLQVAAGGPKMTAITGTMPPGVTSGNFRLSLRPEGLHISGSGSMVQMARLLYLPLEEPVVNKTGLTGVYKIDLAFSTPDGKANMGGLRLFPQLDGETQKMNAPPIFTALTEQLGLKLEKTKAPIEMLVIDSANKQPLGN